MKTIVSIVLNVILTALWCPGQSTFTITFDGPPEVPRGTARVVQFYSEFRFWFEPLPGTDGFIRQAAIDPRIPDNGTAYLQASLGDSLSFYYLDGPAFGLVSVDLAGYSTVVPDFTVNFVGYRTDGSTIHTSFSGTGINFRTVHFSPDWAWGLIRVEIPNYAWSLDNLVVVIPEPSTFALTILGGAMFTLWRMRRRRL
jgi:hypothetical protein